MEAGDSSEPADRAQPKLHKVFPRGATAYQVQGAFAAATLCYLGMFQAGMSHGVFSSRQSDLGGPVLLQGKFLEPRTVSRVA